MRIPQKWQYALRAVFELAKRGRPSPTKVSEIAEAQGIPPRFLEVILNQLKSEGIVDSRRGSAGGYLLLRSPHALTVGEVMRCLDGDGDPLQCEAAGAGEGCRFHGDCVFLSVWEESWRAMWQVYDGTTFQQLVDEAQRRESEYVPTYTI